MEASVIARRQFLATGAALAVAISPRAFAQEADDKPFFGIYPIAWTPCTLDGKVDLAALAAQVKFCQRGQVAGLVWPQNASAWATLSDQEWNDGVNALLSAAKGGATKIVIGVQTADSDTEKSVARARMAAANGASGIISLPPENADPAQTISYYKAIGAATSLPLMMQAVGNVSVELVAEIFREIPTLKAIKDEAGNPLERAAAILALTRGRLADFSGNGGQTMLTEMALGFSGSCPYVGLADLHQQSFDLWQAGRHREAFDMIGRIAAFNSIPGANEYVLIARNVFAENTILRKAAGAHERIPLQDAQKRFIREALDRFLTPYLKA